MSPVEIDPKIVPWSYRGAYLCLAGRAGLNGRLSPEKDIYLISHHYSAGIPLLALRPHVDPLPAPEGFSQTDSGVTFSATPSCMTWKMGQKVVAEATFQDFRSIRIRGTIPMSFDTEGKLAVDNWRNWIYRVPPTQPGDKDVVELQTTPNNAVRFTILSGQAELTNDAPYDFNFQHQNRRIDISSKSKGGEWEVTISEIETEEGDIPKEDHSGRSFVECEKAMDETFEQYVAEVCSWARQPTSADRLAAYIMWTSTVRPGGYFTSEAVLMSKLWMDKLWSWDNCFNGLALLASSTTLGLGQILLPYSHITPQGRLPDSMMRSELLYDYVKPPIYGWTLYQALALLDPSSTIDAPAFKALPEDTLMEVYTKVSKFTMFWYKHRATAHSAIPYYTHGNDSGWDNSTAFDRQTVCVAPDLAGLLVVQCDFLAKLAKHLHEEESQWAELRDKTLKGLVDELWNEKEGQFLFKDALDGSTWTSTTLLKFLPLVASNHLSRDKVDRMADGLEAHLSEWGLATEQLDSEHYESDGYWRGPIWAPPTIMIESSLRSAGKTKLADTIAERYIKLCEKSGFAENYDAVTGAGNRDLSYTWAASAYLVIRRQQESRI